MTVKEDKPERKGRQQYAELLCDFMFKRLFGSEANKDVLIGFLNMLLEDSDIVDVDFIPTEHLGETEDDRKSIFDISCRCSDGKTFIIEMQRGRQKHFRKRAIYYTTYPINEQGRDAREKYVKDIAAGKEDARFDWDYDLKPVTVVAILNFRFSHEETWPEDRCRSSYRLREDSNHEEMTDTLRFVFLELGRFNKRIWELDTIFDKWMYLLKHMHEMVEIPHEFSDSLFTRLFLLAKIGNFTPEELKQYKNSLENMGDFNNIIHTAVEEAEMRGHATGLAEGLERGREEGEAEGFVKGREEGREEGKAEGMQAGERNKAVAIARNLIEAGMSQEEVARMTGLTVEEVRNI